VRLLVPILARAAVVVGADGLLVEVHPEPEKAASDGEQSLTFEQFDAMMADLEPYLRLRGMATDPPKRPEKGRLNGAPGERAWAALGGVS
jgi:3-deoxy-7-phosphoheptulonate synthase